MAAVILILASTAAAQDVGTEIFERGHGEVTAEISLEEHEGTAHVVEYESSSTQLSTDFESYIVEEGDPLEGEFDFSDVKSSETVSVDIEIEYRTENTTEESTKSIEFDYIYDQDLITNITDNSAVSIEDREYLVYIEPFSVKDLQNNNETGGEYIFETINEENVVFINKGSSVDIRATGNLTNSTIEREVENSITRSIPRQEYKLNISDPFDRNPSTLQLNSENADYDITNIEGSTLEVKVTKDYAEEAVLTVSDTENILQTTDILIDNNTTDQEILEQYSPSIVSSPESIREGESFELDIQADDILDSLELRMTTGDSMSYTSAVSGSSEYILPEDLAENSTIDLQVESSFQNLTLQSGTVSAEVVRDTSGDGLLDSEDECPEEFGHPENDGCPPETLTLSIYEYDDGVRGDIVEEALTPGEQYQAAIENGEGELYELNDGESVEVTNHDSGQISSLSFEEGTELVDFEGSGRYSFNLEATPSNHPISQDIFVEESESSIFMWLGLILAAVSVYLIYSFRADLKAFVAKSPIPLFNDGNRKNMSKKKEEVSGEEKPREVNQPEDVKNSGRPEDVPPPGSRGDAQNRERTGQDGKASGKSSEGDDKDEIGEFFD